ncbi:DUF1631 domain-containing protein [Luteimonas sp. BDR2-5]|uniref:DUF1631 family protein n=1 Tax=Proluteimonas luteida TaxID=2878685 RepID=UPI001E337D0D|nr:DUF1631 family protein [Luteimonas sp. BDR2-5]MCD9027103.1 DUF1631 domain-containing protein [Luteimonas sp. BDR2-5]
MPASSIARDAPPPRSLASAGLPPRVRRSLDDALALVSSALEPLLATMVTEFEQELFRLADQARNPGLESGYMHALRAFRLNRADLLPHFLLAMEAALAGLRTPPASAHPPGIAESGLGGFGALRLVEDAVMDESTVLREIASRQEGRASLSLHLLGQRFGVLAASPAFDAEHIPLGPQCLCRAIQTSATALDIEHDARLLLYRIFDRVVMSGYATILEQLDAALAQSGVLPALTYVPMRTRATPVDNGAAPVAAGGDAGTAARPQAAATAARTRAQAHSDAPHRPFTAWGDASEAPAPGDGEDHESAYRRLQQLMSGRRELLRKLRPQEGRLGPPPQQLPTRDVTDALHRLQAQPGSMAARSLAEIKQSLLAQARQRSGEAATLAPQDEDAFELLSLLYGHLEEEIRSEAPSATLIRELQIPMLRVALQDHSFFTRQRHPARELLNTVAESAARWLEEPGIDPRLLAALRDAVAHVRQNYLDDIQVFTDGNTQLQTQLQAQARTAELQERRHVEAARGKEKLASAKLRAAEAMQALIGEQRLPRFSRALLDQAWADVLTLTLLRHGEASRAWQQQLAVTRQIVDAAIHDEAPRDPDLQSQVETSLGQVGYHGEEAGVIAQRLTQPHSADDDAASRTELAMKLKARTRLGEDADAARRPRLPPRTPEEQAHYDNLRTLPFGTWIEFSINQQGDVVRRRMSWFSPITDNVLFVNQRGQRIGEQSLDAVARLLASGSARIVTADRGHIVDRAWQAAISALRSFAGRGDRPMEQRA